MGPFLADRPAQRHGAGREVGGACQSTRRPYGLFRPAKTDRVRRFWNAPRMAASEGLKAVDMFEAIETRNDQGALGHGDKSGRVAARARGAFSRGADEKSSNCSSCPRDHAPHRPPSRRGAHVALCLRPPGARKTAPSPIRSGVFRGKRAFLPRPGEAQPRLVDRQRSGPAASASRARFAYRKPADVFFASMRPLVGVSRMMAGATFDLGWSSQGLADDDYDPASTRLCGP